MSLPAQPPSQRDPKYEAYLREWGIGNRAPIARGKFGRVVKVPGERLVAKLESPRLCNPEDRRDYVRIAETGARIHSELQRNGVPHVPRQISAMRIPGESYCTIMEDAGPNLYQTYLEEKRRPEIEDLETIGKMALEALVKMHALLIAHLDLKLENMFWGHIADFGASRYAEKPLNCPCVSRFYRAPEVIFGRDHGIEVDLWSLGCDLFELLMSRPAFPCGDEGSEHEADLTHIHAIEVRIGKIPLEAFQTPKGQTFLVADQAGNLSIKKPKKPFGGSRTIQQILSQYNDGTSQKAALVDLILKMLVIDPKKRITAAEALKHPFFRSDFSTDLQFHLHLRGEDLGKFKTGYLKIENQSGRLLERITLQFVEDHSCFHLPKQFRPYKIRYFNGDGVSEKEIERTIENGVLTLSRKDFPEISLREL